MNSFLTISDSTENLGETPKTSERRGIKRRIKDRDTENEIKMNSKETGKSDHSEEKTVHFSVRVISESQVYPAKLFSTKKRAQKVKNYSVLNKSSCSVLTIGCP